MQSPLSVGNFGGNSAGALENQFKLLFYKGIPHFAQFLSGEQSVRRQKLNEAADARMNSKVLSLVNRPAHGLEDGRYSRFEMLEALSSPWSVIGAVAGLLIALLVHGLAPADIDTVHAGAWLVGIGWLAGLAWDLVDSDRAK